jgi:hypothetical protein
LGVSPQVLTFLALLAQKYLLYWYKSKMTRLEGQDTGSDLRYTKFTFLTGTRILKSILLLVLMVPSTNADLF